MSRDLRDMLKGANGRQQLSVSIFVIITELSIHKSHTL